MFATQRDGLEGLQPQDAPQAFRLYLHSNTDPSLLSLLLLLSIGPETPLQRTENNQTMQMMAEPNLHVKRYMDAMG